MTNLSKMNSVINELADKDFKFGKNDCYVFTAELVKAWHGKDYTKLHAVYETELDAEEYMRAHGGIEALTTGTLGYSIDPLECRDGDVVSAQVGVNGKIGLGFVYDGYGLFKSGKKVKKLKLNKCRKGWRIN